VADQRRAVDRRRLDGQPREVVGERVEALRLAVGDQVQRRHRRAVAERRQADAAVADHHRGDALARLRRHRRIGEQQPVVVRVHVDEARRDGAAVAGRPRLGIGRVEAADGGDAAAGERDVAVVAGGAGAVEDHCVAQQQVELG
jgi:hypothetical protein